MKNTTQTKTTALQLAVLDLLLKRLNDCRTACPGIGGDIDALNVRWMREAQEWHPSTVAQAVKSLAALADGINTVKAGRVDCSDALNAVQACNAHAGLVEALRLVVEQDDRSGLAQMIRETDGDGRTESDENYLGAIDSARAILEA